MHLFFFGRLVELADFHWFSTTSPFPSLSCPLLPLLWASPPQTSKNYQTWTGSASLKTSCFMQGSQLCCLGRFGREKSRNYWKVAGTHHTLEMIGFCRHRFQMKAVADMHGLLINQLMDDCLLLKEADSRPPMSITFDSNPWCDKAFPVENQILSPFNGTSTLIKPTPKLCWTT